MVFCETRLGEEDLTYRGPGSLPRTNVKLQDLGPKQ